MSAYRASAISRRSSACLIVAATVLAAACLPKHATRPPDKSRDEVAAVLVSATMVAPWKQVADAMAPNFGLANGDAALQQVAPITDRSTEQVLRAFGLSLGLGLPQSSRSSTATTTTGAGANAASTLGQLQNAVNAAGTTQSTSETAAQSNGNATNASSSTSGTTGSSNTTSTTSSNTTNGTTNTTNTTTTVTSTTGPGVAPAPPTGTPAGGQLPQAPANTGSTDIDPILKYQGAQALYQAVQLMNREVQFAATRSGFVPYLVQIKLAVIPYKRRLPYDVHARISFFLGCGKGAIPVPYFSPVRAIESAPGPQFVRAVALTSGPRAQAQAAAPAPSVAPTKQPDPCADVELPVVVPLLVTDDVERAIRSRASETARQIAVALGAMTGGLAANLGANNLSQALTTDLGQELNSHLMVSRLSDNTMYARVGGTADPSSGANLVGQNYNISVLLLVPDRYAGGRDIQIVTSTDLRNFDTGQILRNRPRANYQGQFQAAIDSIFPNPATVGTPRAVWNSLDAPTRLAQITSLVSVIEKGDFKEYVQTTKATFAATALDTDLKSLWTRLTSLIADSSFKSAVFALPVSPPIAFSSSPSVATIFDDTKTATVVLQNTGWISDKTLGATLDLVALRNGMPVPTPLPAQSLVVDQKRQTLTLMFPSPAKWGIDQFDQAASKLVIAIDPCMPDPCERRFALSVVKSADAPDEKAAFTFTSQVKAIVPNAGVGAIDVTVDKMDKTKYDHVKITWTGGMLMSALDGGKPATLDGGAVSLADNATIRFTFSNLVPQMPLVLTAEGMKDKKSVAKANPLQFAIHP